MTTREEAKSGRKATTTGLLLGTLIGAAVLLVTAAALTGGPGNALKSVVAVWLAALPLIGFGALCGWLVAIAVTIPGRRRATRERER